MPIASEIFKNALTELGVIDPGEVMSSQDVAWCLSKYNRLVGSWNVRRLFMPSVVFTPFTIVPNTQPLTIGPTSANFTMTQRPSVIKSAAIVYPGSTASVQIGLTIRDSDWWANNNIPDLPSELPTDLYYSPDTPLGKIYLWPIPTVAYQIELETWNTLAKVTAINQSLTLPEGYEDALTFSLAESLAPSFKVPISAELAQAAALARAHIQVMNSTRFSICGRDQTLPVGDGTASYSDFVAGKY